MLSLVGSSLISYQWLSARDSVIGLDRIEASFYEQGVRGFQWVMRNLCRIDSDNESYYKESPEVEEEAVGPLQIQINMDESAESPPPGLPAPVQPQQIPVEEPFSGWELLDDSNNLNSFTRQDVVNLKIGPWRPRRA